MERTASECRSGSPSQPGIDGIRRSSDGETDQPERKERRRAVERAAAAEEEREPEHEQEVPDHAARERAAHDLGEAVVDREEGDDQLGRVAEGGVEEAADAGARVVGRVLGRLADQPRERDQASAASTKSTVDPG